MSMRQGTESDIELATALEGAVDAFAQRADAGTRVRALRERIDGALKRSRQLDL